MERASLLLSLLSFFLFPFPLCVCLLRAGWRYGKDMERGEEGEGALCGDVMWI